MKTAMLRLAAVAVLVGSHGCAREPDAGSTTPAADDPFSFAPSAPPYEGPPFRFDVTIEGPATQFRWTVSVPTGGWEVKFEGGKTDPRIDHAAVKVLLVRPGPDEMVTQALEDLSGEYRHGKMNAKTAELLVRIAPRGSEPEDDYRVAATWSASE
ncbi:MAG: hypothetical protein ACYTGP_07550 [Planctomycetota bacterium]|jgi:hypothetical protein